MSSTDQVRLPGFILGALGFMTVREVGWKNRRQMDSRDATRQLSRTQTDELLDIYLIQMAQDRC